MGYMWVIPVLIIAVVVLLVAIGARRRRRSGSDKALNEDKPIVP